ncbi:SDR family NAD(P)-dependent oxidoreductase [Candidatus Puniceispirillum sp.]|nr:SDR family NAD(P)-dependent oxidoreductase [Candidatus Puniceispirillum sp.]
MAPDLSGKVILITGASRGIGKAVALAATHAGAELIITGRTIGALEDLDDEIKAANGKATIVELDMSDYAAIPRLAQAIHERWGRLDGLVVNAATLGALTPLSHLDEAVWDNTISINLTAQWHLIRAMEPLLISASAGRAVLVSSGVAEGVKPFWGPYAVSKAGLEAMGRVWAGETEQTNLRINIINPGGTATEMRASAFPGENQKSLPQPADIAPAFLTLLDPKFFEHGKRFDARIMLSL